MIKLHPERSEGSPQTLPQSIASQPTTIAKGSCAEVRSMLHLAKDIGYIRGEEYFPLLNLSEQISRLLSGFIKALCNPSPKK